MIRKPGFGCLAAVVAVIASCTALAAPTAPTVDARAWLLLDATSGQTLASSNADQRIEPASLTKLMTAYLAFAALRDKSLALGQSIRVSERAWRARGSRMFIEPRIPVTVEELLQGLIVQSGNDACIALAEAIAGSEGAFVERMNREAQRLGMTGTHFANSSGLPDRDHYSTANDLGRLVAALIRDYPAYYRLYSEREYRYNDITQQNRNRLLWLDPNVDGVKTGHTESAGYCLIASARRGTRRLVSVLIGASSDRLRTEGSQELLDFGFQAYDGVRLYEKQQTISRIPVWKGSEREVPAGVTADLYVTVPRGSEDKLSAELVSVQPLLAPLSAGRRIATLRISHEGRLLAEYPVVALQDVPVAGILRRAWDGVAMWLR